MTNLFYRLDVNHENIVENIVSGKMGIVPEFDYHSGTYNDVKTREWYKVMGVYGKDPT
jgi:hypothetical protein